MKIWLIFLTYIPAFIWIIFGIINYISFINERNKRSKVKELSYLFNFYRYFNNHEDICVRKIIKTKEIPHLFYTKIRFDYLFVCGSFHDIYGRGKKYELGKSREM